MTKAFLQEKIGNCKFPDKCLCVAKEAYEEISSSDFFIFDDNSNQPSKIMLTADLSQLKVKNTNSHLITFVKVDKCLVPEEKGIKKCDCFLFDKETFFLIEIKSTNPTGRSKARRDAVLQLEDSIQYLISKQINISSLSAKAIICFKNINAYPIKSSQKSHQAVFRAKYNVSLEEGNLIEF